MGLGNMSGDLINGVWERMISAEVRSLYFADLARRYTVQKQWIVGISFFLSSAAAASLGAQAPTWMPLIMAAIVAVLSAYSMAVGLDRKAQTMAKLHYSWLQVETDYERLWNHVHSEEAEADFEQLVQRERELSQLATTDAPNNVRLLEKWEDHVFRQRGLSPA